MLPDDRLPVAPAVGGYWTRTNDVETFDRHDLAALHRHRAALTDEPVPVVAVSRRRVDCPRLDAAYGPGGLLNAWPL
ncbi:hypothetical protein J7E89_19350 [Streptomyces sp. ISL-100]|nr:hypothetical protein [Streptomyces sp. ISL-100]